jgi:hypothetical protein
MAKGFKKASGTLLVSAILGFAGLSTAAQANIRPINECELDVRAYCAANWQWTYGGSGYEHCVYWRMRERCRETSDGGWDEV